MINVSASKEKALVVGYFYAPAVQAPNYHITDIPTERLTHVIYAFADVNPDGTSVSENAEEDEVNLPQLLKLKQQRPGLQTLISVGGASHSINFPKTASSDALRVHFAASCIQFMKENGLDGIDIDWEFPAATDTQNFTALLQELRRSLDAQGATDKRTYLLTIAAPAGPEHYSILELPLIHPLVDWINLMAYDFSVASSKLTDFVAPLKSYDPDIGNHVTLNVDTVLQAYLKAGVPPEKLVLGTRFLGTGWQGVANSNNGLYQNNLGPAKGTWDSAGTAQSGTFGYQDIKSNYLGNYKRYWHSDAQVPWLYSSDARTMISYEDPQSLALKANYALSNALGGVMVWELGADDKQHTLLNALCDGLGQGNSVLTYTVSGQVVSPDSPSVGGLQVQLVDKVVGPDIPLGIATTDLSGQYTLSIGISPATLKARLKTQPDFQVSVSAGNTFLAASEVEYNSSTSVVLNVTLPPGLSALKSEYETLTATLTGLQNGELGGLQENAQQQDLSYLANKSGWDARAIALAALAAQFSATRITPGAPAAAAPTVAQAIGAPTPAAAPSQPAPAEVSLKPDFYYALFRAGLPANADVLYRTSPNTVQAIWQQAIAQNVITPSLASEIAGAVQTYALFSAQNVLTVKAPGGVSTLQEMLQATLADATQQKQFAELYVQYGEDSAKFWTLVQESLGPTVTKKLQLNGQLFYLTLNNAPLVAALATAQGHSPLTSTLDLATRGYYEASKWTTLIGTSIPPGISGDTIDAQRANYAQALAAQVRIAYPTAVLADQVRRNIMQIAGSPAVAAEVATFLANHQEDFQFGVEPVEAYIARNKIAGTKAPVVAQVKRLQRVNQLTQDDTSMAVLLSHNVDSAFAITRYDSAGFERAFGAKLGGNGAASLIHARAKQIFNAVLNVVTAYTGARMGPSLGGPTAVYNSFTPPSSATSEAGSAPDPVIASPTLEDLFGSMDYCNCSDCNSILSPAAYLVDLLNYIDLPAPTLMNPQTVLFQRRPDLQYLPLTCENTNTALPYIDVVNEMLEYAVVSGNQSLTDYQGHDTGTSVTSEQLLASPQYVNDAAYTVLENAFFPPPLPFNRQLELLRLQLQNLGVALPDAMIALRASDKFVDNSTPASYGWSDILIEQLGISRDEYRIFTDSTLQLGDLYGLPNATALKTLQQTNLQDFSRRLGVSYTDLIAIVETQFINPDAVLIPRLQKLNAPFSTLQTLKETLNKPQSIAGGFMSALPAGLNTTQYGGAVDLQGVVNWVTDNGVTDPSKLIYPRIMDLITITKPSGSVGDCSGAALQLRYSNPDTTANSLSATDFLKLIRFIRLWQKLSPLLGDSDDSVTISQIDAILTALYPAADLPVNSSNTANDANNRALLDAGFKSVLMRAGYVFQIMNRLSLTADSALEQLLTCWAPIRTVGVKALYQRLFLTPTLLQQDPGPQTATISDTVGSGDTFKTWINSSDDQPNVVPHTVGPGETPTTVAASIASAINATVTADSVSGLPLNQRFFAMSNGTIISIKAGFSLTCSISTGATESYTTAKQNPGLQTATIAATHITAGDVLTTTIDKVPIPYTVVLGDSTTTIAANIADAINNTTVADTYSGLSLNSLVVASSAGAVVTLIAPNAGGPFALSCLVVAGAATIVAGPPIPASSTVTVMGSFSPTDSVLLTFNFLLSSTNVAISCTASAGMTIPEDWVAGIAATINAAVQPEQYTSLPLKSLVHATSAGKVVTISPVDPSTAFTVICLSTSGREDYFVNGPLPASQSATIVGTSFGGRSFTASVNELDVVYVGVVGDTAATVASSIAELVNNPSTLDPLTGQPLNQLVNATAAGNIITVTALNATTSLKFAVSVSTSTYTAGRQTPPFADNGYGQFLSDTTQTLFGHEPSLRAACNLTGSEFTMICEYAKVGFKASAQLTLENVSMIFRYGWLARTLGLSVLEFLSLIEFTGLNPFAPLPDSTAPGEPPIITLIRLLQAMSASGLPSVQALYLMWNQDISGKSAPPFGNIAGLASDLRAAFAAVETQFVIQDDPTGSIAQGLMTLVYGDSASAFFFSLLNNTFTPSVSYSNPAGQATLPQPVLDKSGGRLSYNDLSKQLSFAGMLDPATANALISAIVDDPALPAGILRLAAASQQTVGPFFATYPELQPLYAAFAASSDPVETKRTTLLSSFLPTLKRLRKQEEALSSITAAAGSDPSYANVLLQNPSVLHADADQTAPAVTDLLAIENGGLSAAFYLDNKPVDNAGNPGVPGQIVDCASPLAYFQTATIEIAAIGGSITVRDVLTTTINGISVLTQVGKSDTSLPLLAAHVAASINGTTPLNQTVSASTSPQFPNVVTIAGVSPLGADNAFSLTCSHSAGATETYVAGSQLPAAAAGGLVAGIWSGFITVPQDGFYDFAVGTDPGASVTLEINGALVPGQRTGGVWLNQSSISLVAGALVPIAWTVTSMKTTFSVSWQSLGLGWEVVPSQYLYPLNLFNRLANTYVRFLKAAAFPLSANEVAYLGSGSSVDTADGEKLPAGATVFTPASMTNIGIGSMLVVDSGPAQEIVTVTAVSANGKSFSIPATKPHDGTGTPFPIVSVANAAIGRGWLNFLTGPGAQAPQSATAASLTTVLLGVLDFARMKQSLSPTDERLLAVLQNPAATLSNGQSALLNLTGWDLPSVNALLTQFFGNMALANLQKLENFRRAFDACAILQTCRISASALIAGVSNAPSANSVSALQSALRAQYAEADWLNVVQPINDTMRIRQRDALVAYILQRLGDTYSRSIVFQSTSLSAATPETQLTLAQNTGIEQGMQVQGTNIAAGTTVTDVSPANVVTLNQGILAAVDSGTTLAFIPPNVPAISTADQLFEYFLVDVLTQPPVQTSRIRLALSSVQLFIERVVRNLEPQVSPNDIDAKQWAYMKRYRLQEANLEVFLWPENWLYPELRDDQSPFFQDMMSSLLQSDITDDAAANAYLNYLTNLEEVAKLEPCGIYYQPGDADTDEASYVVSRTAGAHRKYYFRMFQGGSWTPGTQVTIDCEDMPVTPIVWNGRLFLFWLKILKQAAPNPPQMGIGLPGNTGKSSDKTNIGDLTFDDLQTFGQKAVATQSSGTTKVQAVLCWAEFYNGKWQPSKTSEIARPVTLGPYDSTGSGSFESDCNRVQILPAKSTPRNFTFFGRNLSTPDLSDALILAISTPTSAFPVYNGLNAPGFVLYNTHSLPVRFEDIPIIENFTNLGAYLDIPAPFRILSPSKQYTGRNDTDVFSIQYYDTVGSYAAAAPYYSFDVLGFNWVPRYVDAQPGSTAAWDAPFFFEDRRYLFYVQTSEDYAPLRKIDGIGITGSPPVQSAKSPRIPPLVFPQPPVLFTTAGNGVKISGNQGSIPLRSASLRVALGGRGPVNYQGQQSEASGSLPTT